jgi:hypothetical protein
VPQVYPPVPHPVTEPSRLVTVPWREWFGRVASSINAAITQLTGDVTTPPGGGVVVATLSNTGVVPGTYGDATHVGQFTVDAKGRLTFAQNVVINGLNVTGYSPLTDGDPEQPELIFLDGDVIMVPF